MDIEKITQNDRNARFILHNTTPQLANALRRAMMMKVPTMAIDQVNFRNNTSGLFDEVLAHRIGMVPWTYDTDHYMHVEGEIDETDPTHKVEFVLEKQGENNVYASDLKPTDSDITPTYPDILLLKLLEGQEVDLEARAVLGTGQDHARHQAARATYQHNPVVRVNGENVENNVEAAAAAPDRVKQTDGEVKADSDIVYAMEGAIDIEEGDTIELNEQENTFLFTVKSVSGHNVSYIMEKAADILIDELDAIEEKAMSALQ